VFEMSLDYTFNEWHPKPVQYHYDLASELSDLQNRGILIIGSGNIVLDILPSLKAEDSRIRLCSYFEPRLILFADAQGCLPRPRLMG
jgi:hypothetical protein